MTPRVCLITGGADGLGFALAQRLNTAGEITCLLDLSEARLTAARQELGERCETFVVDMTNETEVLRIVSAIAEKFGRIDVLVNCAGITGQTGIKSHEVPTDNFDKVYAVNVKGTFLACKAVLPHLLARRQGRILNVASIAGKEGNAGMLAYSTSKAAVIGLTKVMGKEYAETGVTINALAPAVIRTALVDNLPETQIKYMTDKIPMRRCGTLEEFAAMAEFIISPANSFTTGFTFDLTGGRAVS